MTTASAPPSFGDESLELPQLDTSKRIVTRQAPNRKAVFFMEPPWVARSKLADIGYLGHRRVSVTNGQE
jgi:hypothetical protein